MIIDRQQKGFALAELVVVMGMIAALFVIASVSLLGAQRKASQDTLVDTLLTDLRSQQTKAMTGDTEGTGAFESYGIYFGSDSYVLFRGVAYNAAEPSNFAVEIDPSLDFTNVTLPGAIIVFTNGSGEISGYASGADSLSIIDSVNGSQKTIQLNRYGTPVVN